MWLINEKVMRTSIFNAESSHWNKLSKTLSVLEGLMVLKSLQVPQSTVYWEWMMIEYLCKAKIHRIRIGENVNKVLFNWIKFYMKWKLEISEIITFCICHRLQRGIGKKLEIGISAGMINLLEIATKSCYRSYYCFKSMQLRKVGMQHSHSCYNKIWDQF